MGKDVVVEWDQKPVPMIFLTTTQTQGDVNFSQGSYKLFSDQVELHPGTTISLGTTVEIKNNE